VKRYIEVIVKKIYFEDNKGDFELVSAKIAHDNRINKRIVVTDKDFYAENFRLSQYSINPSTMDMPISVKVAFDKIKPDLLEKVPNCEAYIYNGHKEDKLSLAAIKTKKIIYIENVYKKANFSIHEKGFLNCSEYFGDTLDKEINNLILNNICSLLIYPVIFVNIKGEGVPVGYFKVTSTEADINKDILFYLDTFAVDIVNYIRDANVTIIKERQEVVNVSRKGVQLLVKDLDVLDTFTANREEIVFDIRPRPTFRITLFAKMVNLNKVSDKNYLIGLKVIGGAKRHGIGAWDSYIIRLISGRDF
jgi:hypothetical protein